MRRAWVSLIIALAGAALAQAALLRPAYPAIAGEPAVESRILELTNVERISRGLRALEPDAGLTLAARAHSEQMARLGFFDHVGGSPPDRTLQQRVARAASTVITVGENIAKFSPRPDLAGEMVRGWMSSPGHRANVLKAEFTHLGVGVVRDRTGEYLATQVFGRIAVEFGSITLDPRRVALTRARFAVHTNREIGVFVEGAFHSLHQPGSPLEFELEFPADGRERQIVIASRPRGTNGAFTAEIAGRVVPLVSPSWRPESEGGQGARLAFEPRVVTEVVEAYRVAFAGRVRGEEPVRLWVNGSEREAVSGSFQVALEFTVNGRTYQVQFLRPQPGGGGQFDVLHEIQVDTSRPPAQALRAGAAQ
jgi:uncharacterized protein YkwD